MNLRFLEFAVGADDVLEVLNFYRALGFAELTTGDASRYPYAVVTDGALTIGLHGADDFEAELRFVRPGVRKWVLDLAETGVEFDHICLDDDELHRASLYGPSRNKATWIEARTFSPATDEIPPSALGRFLEITFPVRELLTAARFWAPYCSRVLGDTEAPARMRLDAHGVCIGISEDPAVDRPILSYEIEDAGVLAKTLSRLGLHPARRAAPAGAAMVIDAPDGCTIALFESDFIAG